MYALGIPQFDCAQREYRIQWCKNMLKMFDHGKSEYVNSSNRLRVLAVLLRYQK